MQFSFDASRHQPRVASAASATVPRGKYQVVLGSADSKETRDKTGGFIEATFFITQGEFAGRKLVSRYNVKNANPTAVEMALNEICALSYAVGLPRWEDTSELMNRPLIVDVDLEEGQWTNQQGQTKPTSNNRIIGYYTMQGQDATTIGQQNAAAQVAAPAWLGQQPAAQPQQGQQWPLAGAPVQGPQATAQWPAVAPVPVPAAAAAPGAAPAPTPAGGPAHAGSIQGGQQWPLAQPQGQQPPWQNGGMPQQQAQPQQPPWQNAPTPNGQAPF